MKAKGKRPAYSYTRTAGTSWVRAVPIPDVGAAGKKARNIGRLKGGMLTRYGYHPVESATSRHRALNLAISKGKEEPDAVARRLQAISAFTKTALPTASRIYRQDRLWLTRKFK